MKKSELKQIVNNTLKEMSVYNQKPQMEEKNTEEKKIKRKRIARSNDDGKTFVTPNGRIIKLNMTNES